MKIEVTEKRNGEPREIDAIFFKDNEAWFVRTVDPKTGHDPADHDPDDLNWTITPDEEDLKKFAILTEDGVIPLIKEDDDQP